MNGGEESISGLAVLGKVSLVLVLMVGLIVLCAWLLKRLAPGHVGGGGLLRVIASKTVGPKERVVVVELEDTWLVLGVGGGQVTKLHERPAPAPGEASQPEPPPPGSFAQRFAQALRGNLQGRSGERP